MTRTKIKTQLRRFAENRQNVEVSAVSLFVLRVNAWLVIEKLVEFFSAKLLSRFLFALRSVYGSMDGASGRQA